MEKGEGRIIKFLSGLWGLVRNNIWLKIVALIFAMILWSYVLADTNPMREKNIVNIPIQFIGLDELTDRGLSVRTSKTPLALQIQVSVDVRQSSYTMLNSQNIDAVVDLSKIAVPGTYMLSVDTTTSIGQVASVNPRELKIEVDRTAQVVVPLTFSLKGALPEGCWMGQPQLPVSNVTVRGAEQDVKRISKAVCEITLDNLVENLKYALTIDRAAPVKLMDDSGQELYRAYFESYEDTLIATIDVAPKRTIGISTADAVTGANELASGYEIVSIEIVPSSVDIIGDYELINSLPPLSVIKVSVRGASEPVTVKTKLIIPDGVRLTGTDEVEIRIDIREKEEEKIFNNSLVSVVGTQTGTKVTVTPGFVDVHILVPLSKLELYVPDSVVPFVDVAGLSKGSYTLLLQFRLPADLPQEKVSALPKEVNVTIE